jgi:hypothetical protein
MNPGHLDNDVSLLQFWIVFQQQASVLLPYCLPLGAVSGSLTTFFFLVLGLFRFVTFSMLVGLGWRRREGATMSLFVIADRDCCLP